MTDDKPTELETFQILEEAAKTLKLDLANDYAGFMKSCMTGGKSAAACKGEWDSKHKDTEMSADMKEYVAFIQQSMKAGKTLKQGVEEWTKMHAEKEPEKPGETPEIPGELKPIMSRLEALENAKKEEIKVTLAAHIVEVKKVDPTFDEKKFLAPFADNTLAAITAIDTYMETVKHFKETLPEIESKMHLGTSDTALAHRKELTKGMFGKDDIATIVKEI